MKPFSHSKSKDIFKKIRGNTWPAKKKKSSFLFLNATQFLGVLNDNLYKLLMVFLLIDTLGHAKASSILSAAGAIYVIPFLLFSSSAGILADRFSKQKLILVLKSTEVFIMVLAFLAFTFKSIWGSYTLLFLLATHSAMFGPSKYGIIPELVPKESVSKANGLITSFTYLAIILGTFLASFLTEITDRGFIYTILFCLLVAVGGLLCSLRIRHTPAQGSNKKVNIFFIREIYRTLKEARQIPLLLPSICGSAFFLFVGAFAQLNIIPFTLQALHLSEVAGGYLFLLTALGIASGSFLAGKILKKKLELGISCLAGIGLSLVFFLIFAFSSHLIPTILLLVLLGIFGGIFIIPFDTYIQLSSPGEKRGQIIAATNFLSFLGVLIASFALYLFSQILSISAALGFGVMGLITLIVVFFLSLSLIEPLLPFFSKKILFRWLSVQRLNEPSLSSTPRLLALENASFLKAMILSGFFPECHFLLQPVKSPFALFCLQRMSLFHFLKDPTDMNSWVAEASFLLEKTDTVCILIQGPYFGEETEEKKHRFTFFQKSKFQPHLIQIEKDPHLHSYQVKIKP